MCALIYFQLKSSKAGQKHITFSLPPSSLPSQTNAQHIMRVLAVGEGMKATPDEFRLESQTINYPSCQRTTSAAGYIREEQPPP